MEALLERLNGGETSVIHQLCNACDSDEKAATLRNLGAVEAVVAALKNTRLDHEVAQRYTDTMRAQGGVDLAALMANNGAGPGPVRTVKLDDELEQFVKQQAERSSLMMFLFNVIRSAVGSEAVGAVVFASLKEFFSPLTMAWERGDTVFHALSVSRSLFIHQPRLVHLLFEQDNKHLWNSLLGSAVTNRVVKMPDGRILPVHLAGTRVMMAVIGALHGLQEPVSDECKLKLGLSMRALCDACTSSKNVPFHRDILQAMESCIRVCGVPNCTRDVGRCSMALKAAVGVCGAARLAAPKDEISGQCLELVVSIAGTLISQSPDFKHTFSMDHGDTVLRTCKELGFEMKEEK